MGEPLRIHTEDAARWIALDRPEVRNAIDVTTQDAPAAALVDATTDDDVGAIVLTGTDPVFSAGGDLSRFEQIDHTAFRFASHELTQVIGLVERIEKPVVAAINGAATGAGAQLALACDVRIASDRARLLWRGGTPRPATQPRRHRPARAAGRPGPDARPGAGRLRAGRRGRAPDRPGQ